MVYTATMPLVENRPSIRQQLPNTPIENGDGILRNGSSMDFLVSGMWEFPLLTAEQEKELGEKIFVARLALRNIKTIYKMLSSEDKSRAQNFLKGRGKFLLDTLRLDILRNEYLKESKTIEGKEEKGTDNSSETTFLEDVRSNDEYIKDKLREFSAIEDDEVKKQAVSALANQQFNFINMGNEAFDQFVNSNLRLVASAAKRYEIHDGLSMGDLNGYGHEGLLIAVARYDYRRGFKFSTYATFWIRQKIYQAVMGCSAPIRVPINRHWKINGLRREEFELKQQGGGDMSPEKSFETGRRNGNNKHTVRAIEALQFVSLNEPAGDEADSLEFGDLIQGPENTEDEAIESLLRGEIEKVMSTVLSEKEREVLRLRFGFYDGRVRTLEEVGREFGVTRERVRQIEAKALRKMRFSQDRFSRNV